MRKLLLSVSLLFSAFGAFAQKVDLDPFHFSWEYRNLPSKPVDTAFKTYSILVDVSGNVANTMSSDVVASKILLQGFDKQDGSGDIRIQVSTDDLIIENNEIVENVSENKNKDGVVTKTYSYYVSVNYTFGGSADFADDKGKTLCSSIKFYNNRKFNWVSKTYSNRSDASNYWRNNRGSIINTIIRDKMYDCIDKINRYVNEQIGFPKTNENLFLWLLDSKKHPEYTAMKERWAALKPALQAVTADEMTDDTKSKINEMIKYFDGIKTTYIKDEKGDKKMRYSAYYNNAMLYLFLDNPAKAIEEANGLIKNEYDAKDGKSLIIKAEAVEELFSKNDFRSRHFVRE